MIFVGANFSFFIGRDSPKSKGHLGTDLRGVEVAIVHDEGPQGWLAVPLGAGRYMGVS